MLAHMHLEVITSLIDFWAMKKCFWLLILLTVILLHVLPWWVLFEDLFWSLFFAHVITVRLQGNPNNARFPFSALWQLCDAWLRVFCSLKAENISGQKRFLRSRCWGCTQNYSCVVKGFLDCSLIDQEISWGDWAANSTFHVPTVSDN